MIPMMVAIDPPTQALVVQLPQESQSNVCPTYADKLCFSQPLAPVLLINKDCPTGFFPSHGYCIPLTSNIPGVIPVFAREIPAECPPGFVRSNGYCQISPGNKYTVLPIIGKECPLGFFRSGQYCFRSCQG